MKYVLIYYYKTEEDYINNKLSISKQIIDKDEEAIIHVNRIEKNSFGVSDYEIKKKDG